MTHPDRQDIARRPSSRAAAAALAVLALTLFFFARPARAAVSTADEVCPPAADPCVVSTAIEINTGADLDFGTRALEVNAVGQLRLKGGVATIRCGRVALRGGGTAIDLRDGLVRAGTLTIEARGTCTQNSFVLCLRDYDCSLQDAGSCNAANARALLEASIVGTALQPGAFILRAAGDITLTSPIKLDAGGSNADAGDVTLRSGSDITLNAAISANGGSNGGGGALTILADGTVDVSAALDVRGGAFDGGFVTVDSGAGVSISNDISAQATAGAGFGGEIIVTSGADIELTGGTSTNRVDVSTRGHGPVDGAGGDGGYHAYMAAGDISVTRFVRLRADGGAPDGAGGEVLIDAGGTITLAGSVEGAGLGTKGAGGLLELQSGGDTTITSTAILTFTGGSDGGGIADLDAGGNLTLAGVLDVSGVAGGIVGSAALTSQRATTLTGTLRTRGAKLGTDTSSPKLLQVSGCEVELASPALLDNLAAGRTNVVLGRDSVKILAGAQMLATATGVNEVRYRPTSGAPVLQGTISPAATVIADATIQRCPICGDGTQELGETCDDGNSNDGDGCSAECQNEGCIADTPGYPGIALCDDGKSCTLDSCDSANSTCVHTVNCVDGIGCTSDFCGEDGSCEHAPSDALCDDSNPCTIGLCDMINDCVMLPASGPCDDGLTCTSGDSCVDRKCVGDDTCPDGEFCRPATDQCEIGEPTTTTTVAGGFCGDFNLDANEECDGGDTSWQPGEECRADCTLVDCADPDDSGSLTATDALFVLRGAVGLLSCGCLCDVDASGSATASDALRVLRLAVGIPDAPPNCNCD